MTLLDRHDFSIPGIEKEFTEGEKRKSASPKKRLEVWAKSKGRCWYCGFELPEKGWHVDHFKPLGGGGKFETIIKDRLNDIENLVPSCAGCNLFKSVYTVEGFREKIEHQREQVRKYSTGFRIAERMGIIEVKPDPVVFWFERKNN